MSTTEAITLDHWIGNERIPSTATEHQTVYNPSTGNAIAMTPMGTTAEVDRAAVAAAEAFRTWSTAPVAKRASVLFAFKARLEAEFEPLAELISRENGKTFSESQGDLRRGIEVVEFACGIGHLQKGESIPQLADGIDGLTSLEPLGVCAGITPFNFPAMVPLWMFPVAIACGNTFILKPSEKVPQTALRMAELFAEAGLPKGVLNIVLGGREVVDALCTHPAIAAVSFVGSSLVAKHVYQLGCSHGKRVQAAGGAKNVMVVLPDAEEDSTLRAIMGAAYGCAGQRCMAGSILLGVGNSAERLRGALGHALPKLRMLPTDRHRDSELGPVIDAMSRDRIHRAINEAESEGAEVAIDGRSGVPGEGFFVGPTLLDRVEPAMKVANTEIFGPVLSLGRPDSLEAAIAWINGSSYGNGTVIFTQSGAAAREFSRRVHCGMVGINVGVPAPMAVFAFSGWNQSFFGDLHVQGTEGIRFYTRQKTVLSRWDANYIRKEGW